MKIQINSEWGVKIEPLNWIVLRKEKGRQVHQSFFNEYEQFIRFLLKNCSRKDRPIVLDALGAFEEKLNLKAENDLSAWYLTNVRKHPAFVRKVSPKSVQSLKKHRFQSRKNRSKHKKGSDSHLQYKVNNLTD